MLTLPRRLRVTWHWLLAFMPVCAFATPVSLPQALVAAQEYSAELSASRHQINALDNRADAAMQLPDPKLKFGIENLPVGGNNTRRFTREGMTMQRIGIMQDYVSSTKRERKADTLRAESRQVAAGTQSIRARLQRDTALAWMALAIGEQNVGQADSLVAESERQIGVQRGGVSSGSALPASVLDARLTLIAMQDTLTQAKRDVELARTRLSQLTGIDHPDIHGEVPAVSALPASAQQADSVSLHPEILQARREAEVAQSQILRNRRLRRCPTWVSKCITPTVPTIMTTWQASCLPSIYRCLPPRDRTKIMPPTAQWQWKAMTGWHS